VEKVFGRVPHPPFLDRPIQKPAGWGQDDLGPRTVKGVVWHRMIGSLWGTDAYFRQPTTKALTDYGVGVLAQDGADNAGVIIRWNNPLGRQSGWASGSFSSFAYGDGLAFVNKYGINAINRDEASVEISGLTYDVPLDPASKASVAAITAYWADQYEVPWDVFPIAPQDGFSFVRWHNEFGPDEGTKKCPGAVVMDATPELIEMTRAILKQYQEREGSQPVPPKEEPPVVTDGKYPEGMDAGIAAMLFGKVTVGKTVYQFDPKGPVSKAWLLRGKTTGLWPELVKVKTFDTRTYFVFGDGFVLWQPRKGDAVRELKA
jgi:hypothetical protein